MTDQSEPSRMNQPGLARLSDAGQRLAASFRDPSGFLFRRSGRLYRQVNQTYGESLGILLDSGLYDVLSERGLLIRHVETDVEPLDPSTSFAVIEPEEIPFISYPYEWCFSQLKDAALTTLAIQTIALDFGLSLKDASAYNIQFLRGRPVLIDTLSFEPYQEGEPWVAYRQFCQHFLAPLALMSYRDMRLGQLLTAYIDGVPLDLASRLLPARTKLRFGLLTHLHLHAKAQRRYSGSDVIGKSSSRQVSKNGLEGLLDSLRRTVERLSWTIGPSEWVDYYENEHRYSDEAFESKRRLVTEWVERVAPSSAWDLGANTGVFSRIASGHGASTVAFDVDFGAVERNYSRCRKDGDERLLSLYQDLTNPSAGIGWAGTERQSLAERGPVDLVLALALIHHLAISNNVPLANLADFFHGICHWLILEFVPKGDSQVDRLLASREDVFPEYDRTGFESAFSRSFEIVDSVQVAGSSRRLYLLEAR